MHARLPVGETDCHIARLACGLFGATNGQIRAISRQTVGGEVAVSTVEHHRHLDAGAHGQIAVKFSKGERALEVQVVAVEGFDAPLQRIDGKHAAAAEVEEAVVQAVICRISDHISDHRGKVFTDRGKHLVQAGESALFIAKGLDRLRRKALVPQRALHECQVVGDAGQGVVRVVGDADQVGLLHGWGSFWFGFIVSMVY